MIWRWALVLVLVVLSAWNVNLALGYWWAAGGPPTPHPQIFEARGNLHFGLACLFFLPAVIISVLNIRHRRKTPQ